MSRPRHHPHHHNFIWRLILGWYPNIGSHRETLAAAIIRPGLAGTPAHAYNPTVSTT